MTDSYCHSPFCSDPTRGGRTYCPRCEKRLQRGVSLSAPVVPRDETPEERLLEAGLAWLDAPAVAADAEQAALEDGEYQRLRLAFLRRIEWYALAKGWTPPNVPGCQPMIAGTKMELHMRRRGWIRSPEGGSLVARRRPHFMVASQMRFPFMASADPALRYVQ